jgi:hypothetical protein
MRRSTVLSLPVQLMFPGWSHIYYHRRDDTVSTVLNAVHKPTVPPIHISTVKSFIVLAS